MTIKKRPVLENLVQQNTTEVEEFQNTTLRPIIKMQHNLLLEVFKNNLEIKKIAFNDLSLIKRKEKITSILKNDNAFKKLILGIIIGCFSLEEFSFYKEKSSELNRRIYQIITQRLQDSLDLVS